MYRGTPELEGLSWDRNPGLRPGKKIKGFADKLKVPQSSRDEMIKVLLNKPDFTNLDSEFIIFSRNVGTLKGVQNEDGGLDAEMKSDD